MQSIEQIMRAAARYADSEIIPRMPTGKGIGLGVMLALMMDGGRQKLMTLREHPAVQMMGIMDESGNVDTERLYSTIRPRMEGKKLPVNIPLIGEMRFDVNDLDRFYGMIQEET